MVKTVVELVNVLVFVYAVFHLFSNYSEVRFMYLVFSFLHIIVADLYDYMGRKLSSAVFNVISVLFALKAVF
jgi:hypothetical protein